MGASHFRKIMTKLTRLQGFQTLKMADLQKWDAPRKNLPFSALLI